MIGLIALYICCLHHKYNKAKEQGTVPEWRIKTINWHLWAISGLVFIYAILLIFVNYNISQDKWAPLKWEPVLIAILSCVICPLFVRKILQINKIAAVLIPIIWTMVCILYIPITTGCSLIETITITCIGILRGQSLFLCDSLAADPAA